MTPFLYGFNDDYDAKGNKSFYIFELMSLLPWDCSQFNGGRAGKQVFEQAKYYGICKFNFITPYQEILRIFATLDNAVHRSQNVCDLWSANNSSRSITCVGFFDFSRTNVGFFIHSICIVIVLTKETATYPGKKAFLFSIISGNYFWLIFRANLWRKRNVIVNFSRQWASIVTW